MSPLFQSSGSARETPGLVALGRACLTGACGLIPQARAGSLWLAGRPFGSSRAITWFGHLDAPMSRLQIPLCDSLLGEIIRRNSVMVGELDAPGAGGGAGQAKFMTSIGVPIRDAGVPIGAYFLDVLSAGGLPDDAPIRELERLADEFSHMRASILKVLRADSPETPGLLTESPALAERVRRQQALLLASLPERVVGSLDFRYSDEALLWIVEMDLAGWPGKLDVASIRDAMAGAGYRVSVVASDGRMDIMERIGPLSDSATGAD